MSLSLETNTGELRMICYSSFRTGIVAVTLLFVVCTYVFWLLKCELTTHPLVLIHVFVPGENYETLVVKGDEFVGICFVEAIGLKRHLETPYCLLRC